MTNLFCHQRPCLLLENSKATLRLPSAGAARAQRPGLSLQGRGPTASCPPPTAAGLGSRPSPRPVPGASMKMSNCPQERRAKSQVLGEGEEEVTHRAAGFLRTLLLSRTFQSFLFSGPLYKLILCLRGLFQTTCLHFHPPTSYSFQSQLAGHLHWEAFLDAPWRLFLCNPPPPPAVPHHGSTCPTDWDLLTGRAGPARLSPAATVPRGVRAA